MGGKAAGAGMEVMGSGKGWEQGHRKSKSWSDPWGEAGAGFGMRLLLPQNFLASMSGRQPGFGEFRETSRAVAGGGGGE